jgi:hypothetical protein
MSSAKRCSRCCVSSNVHHSFHLQEKTAQSETGKVLSKKAKLNQMHAVFGIWDIPSGLTVA